MNKKEKELFLRLCSFCAPDKETIKKSIDDGAATPELLGYLHANRMAGVAHGVLEKLELLSCVDREFRNSLASARLMNEKFNDDYLGCLNYITAQLDSCGVPYALLKGAYLFGKYPLGYRTSNDVDVLVAPEDVGKVSTRLKLAGFKQGHIRNGRFTEATRQEIIESKMMRGETVPFIKEIKLPFIKYLEVDINFSLDYKSRNDDSVERMLERAVYVKVRNSSIRTLCEKDFILHLCAHLYKEATTVPWIRMKRDMTFYKFCDVYMMTFNMDEAQLEALILYADGMKMEKELMYCLNAVKQFFDISNHAIDTALSKYDRRLLDEVAAPTEKKAYCYEEPDIVKRFFTKDRMKLLREVT